MDVIFVLIPTSVVLVLLALRALAWAIDSGQFEELDRESRRILFDGVRPRERTGAAPRATADTGDEAEARGRRNGPDAPAAAPEEDRRATGEPRP